MADVELVGELVESPRLSAFREAIARWEPRPMKRGWQPKRGEGRELPSWWSHLASRSGRPETC